ncbi:MAG TPA: PilZ domain-containing protein [bacterium]|nr:PilZ domain-containing protein [bacterium]
MEEHRYQKRVAKNLLAKVMTQTSEFFGFVQDLAQGGLGLTTNRKIDPGTNVDINLNIPAKPTMKLNGRIAWRRDLPALAKNKYQLGVALQEPPEEYTKFVIGLIQNEMERRKDKRFTDILEIHNEDVLDLLDAATADVSAGGLYVRTGRPLPVGKQFELKLAAPALLEPIFCLGEVVATFECDPDDLDHAYGAGIKIISFIGEGEERFSAYIRTLDELFKFHWPPDIPNAHAMAVAAEAEEIQIEDEEIPIE